MQIKEFILSQWFYLLAEGFPKHKDEPQHYRIGETIIKNLETFNIKSKILSKNYVNQIKQTVDNAKIFKSLRFNCTNELFEKYEKKKSKSKNLLKRYEFLKFFYKIDKKDVTISSLGNVSRELFVLNERFKEVIKKLYILLEQWDMQIKLVFQFQIKENKKEHLF